MTVTIQFFDEFGIYALRRWEVVPRVGDEVMLHAGQRYKSDGYGKATFRVKRLVWGVESPDEERMKIQCVNVELEALSDKVE